MEFQLSNIKKYPKSASGLQCIAPCYPKNKRSIHPIRMDIITSNEHSYCAVNQFSRYDPEKDIKEELFIDKCYNVQENDKDDKNENILNIIVPFMDFNLKQFLVIFYNIHTYENGIEYINKNITLPNSTLERIYEAMLNVYGSSVDIIDNRTIDFIIKIIKESHINIFYERLKKYLYVDTEKEEIYLKKSSQSDNNEYIIIKTNYIIKSFINPNDVSKFLFKYFKTRRNDFESNDNNIKSLMDDFCTYIINIILASLEK
jgi:hypothetical protein